MAKHEIREGDLTVSLTDDAYDYNDKFFTLEVTELAGDEGTENDVDVSNLPVDTPEADISVYLDAAMAAVKARCGSEINVRNVASYAAQAGISAIHGAKPKSGLLRGM